MGKLDHFRIPSLALIRARLFAAVVVCVWTGPVVAQPQTAATSPKGNEITEDELHSALQPPPPAVSTLPPGVRMRGARLSSQATAPRNASVALSINFSFASSEVLSDSLDLLTRLAHAIMREDMARDRFEIVGHTDAAGSAQSNMTLSLRRAKAVRDYLVQAAGVDSDRLTVSGRGQTEPLNLSDPLAAENRRVEVINLGAD